MKHDLFICTQTWENTELNKKPFEYNKEKKTFQEKVSFNKKPFKEKKNHLNTTWEHDITLKLADSKLGIAE